MRLRPGGFIVALYRTDFTPHDSHGICDVTARTFTGRTYWALLAIHQPRKLFLHVGVRLVKAKIVDANIAAGAGVLGKL